MLRDRSTIEYAADITPGDVLVNGKRSVYILIIKGAASMLNMVIDLKKSLPKMRQAVPEDMTFNFALPDADRHRDDSSIVH